MLNHTRPAALHTYERRMIECAPWVATDVRGADALITALLDSSGYDAHWLPSADFGGDPRQDARTVAATPAAPAARANAELASFASILGGAL